MKNQVQLQLWEEKMKRLMIAALLSTTALVGTAGADTADGDALIGQEWEAVVEMARGGEVNWFMWGGADNINAYVTDYVGGILMDEYGISLNQVPLTDTVEAVNIVLGEKEAGNMDAGSVDMIWINGENFRSMRQGDLALLREVYYDLIHNQYPKCVLV